MAVTANRAYPIIDQAEAMRSVSVPKLAAFANAVDADVYALQTGKQDAAARLAAIVATGITAAMFATNVVDNDSLMAANSNTRIPTQAAVKAYADGLFAANDAMVYKGAINASTNPNYPAADAGHLYRISVAGKIGGASGPNVEVGDTVTCVVDGSAAGNHATVGANWNIVQANLDGAVIGPSSAAAGRIATFSGTSGKLIQDSGYSIGTSGANTIGLLNGANTWGAAQTFSGGITMGAIGSAGSLDFRTGFAVDASGGVGFKAIDHSGGAADGLGIYGHDGVSIFVGQTSRIRVTTRVLITGNDENFALGIKNRASANEMYIGTTNSATPDLVFSNTGGAEVARFSYAGNATFTGSLTVSGALLSLGQSGAAKLYMYSSATANSGLGIDLSGVNYELSLFAGGNADNLGRISFGRRRSDTGTYAERMLLDLATGVLTVGGGNAGGTHGDITLNSHDNFGSFIRYNQNGGARWVVGRAITGVHNNFEFWNVSLGAVAITIAVANNAVRFNGYGAGTLVTDSSGNITASSDERLKRVRRKFKRGLADILAMDAPVTFTWRKDSGLDTRGEYTGFTAQGVQKGIPEAIGKDPRGFLTLQDRPILAAHHNAIRELHRRIETLEAKLAA